MKLETAKSLHDLLTACRRIEHFSANSTREQYRDDLSLQLIIERLFILIGEALVRIERSDQDVADQIPEYRRIIGLRNRVVHEYDEIDNDILWDIVVTRAPLLSHAVSTLLDSQIEIED